MSRIALNLIVLRTANLPATLTFYRALGMEFVEEQHGRGPVHFSCTLREVVLEIYPGETGVAPSARTAGSVMLGLEVASLQDLEEKLKDANWLTLPRDTPAGRRGVILDPDRRAIQISEHPK